MKLTLLAVTLATLAPCLAAPAVDGPFTGLEKRQVECRTVRPASQYCSDYPNPCGGDQCLDGGCSQGTCYYSCCRYP
ncbi:hypothetical protein LZ554_008310 [Drepanopeziza brunnea f. sp. 'monogermtubi']|nr:hypothetical protein LZ554_008310 [Drepanopeziza brunnea f. sp. 'monogermtubi']